MYTKNSKKDDNFIGCFENEKWAVLNWNGILVPRYNISSYGRIYDNRDKRFLGYSLDKDGYYMASIYIDSISEGCKYKKIRVHRFELMSFEFRSDFNNLVANHKDGNKLNLLLSNLEWTLPIENTRHGWNTGLNNNIGINNGNGKYDDSTINTICRLIDEEKSNSEISDIFGITDIKDRMRFSATITGIRNFKTHTYISKNYNFAKNQVTSKQYDLEIAHLVCKLLSDESKTYTYQDIMTLLNIPNEECKIFKIYVNDLLRGRTAKQVVCQYNNLKKPME